MTSGKEKPDGLTTRRTGGFTAVIRISEMVPEREESLVHADAIRAGTARYASASPGIMCRFGPGLTRNESALISAVRRIPFAFHGAPEVKSEAECKDGGERRGRGNMGTERTEMESVDQAGNGSPPEGLQLLLWDFFFDDAVILLFYRKFMQRQNEFLEEALQDRRDASTWDFPPEIDKSLAVKVGHAMPYFIGRFPKQLREACLIMLAASFETFLVGIIRSLLELAPGLTDKPVTNNAKKRIKDRSGLDLRRIEAQMNELAKNRSIQHKLDYLKRLLKKYRGNSAEIDLDVERICEFFETRNLLVHNRGVIDKRYVQKTNNHEFRVGDQRTVSDEYLAASRKAMVSAVKKIYIAFA
jgi:hypothetical protein